MAHDASDPVKEEIARLQASLLGEEDVDRLRATMLGQLKNLQEVNNSRIDTAEKMARQCRDSRSNIVATPSGTAKAQKAGEKSGTVERSAAAEKGATAERGTATERGAATEKSPSTYSIRTSDTDLTSKFAAIRSGLPVRR